MKQSFIIGIGIATVIVTVILAFLIVFVIGMYGEDTEFHFFETFESNGNLDFSLANLSTDISNSNSRYYKTVSYEILKDFSLNAPLPKYDISYTPHYRIVSNQLVTDYSANSPNILPLTKYDTSYNSYYYDTNNYDVQYHSIYNNKLESTGIWVKNASGKLEYIEWSEVPKYSTYYQPNTLKYGPSNYVPSYEDTVYLRKYTDKKNVVYER